MGRHGTARTGTPAPPKIRFKRFMPSLNRAETRHHGAFSFQVVFMASLASHRPWGYV